MSNSRTVITVHQVRASDLTDTDVVQFNTDGIWREIYAIYKNQDDYTTEHGSLPDRVYSANLPIHFHARVTGKVRLIDTGSKNHDAADRFSGVRDALEEVGWLVLRVASPETSRSGELDDRLVILQAHDLIDVQIAQSITMN